MNISGCSEGVTGIRQHLAFKSPAFCLSKGCKFESALRSQYFTDSFGHQLSARFAFAKEQPVSQLAMAV
jgi:hypothetical protein